MTKRDLLLAICENPGWAPQQPTPGLTERYLQELRNDNLIVPRLDGWEASGMALSGYPNFTGMHPELAGLEEDRLRQVLHAVDVDGPPESDGRAWDFTTILPLITLSGQQRIEAPIAEIPGGGVQGSITLANRTGTGRREVEVTIRVRQLDNPF